MKNKPNPFSRAGFTLVELLVVIIIIAALAAVAFSLSGRMKKRGTMTKNLMTMRQVGVLTANYSSDNGNNLPPVRADVQNSDGSWRSGDDWPWVVLTQLYPDVDRALLSSEEWWKINKPMMYNPLIVNNVGSGKFRAAKNGHGINTAIAGQLFGWAGSWTPGDGGYQTRLVPISLIPRPSRTMLFISAPDYNFTAGNFTRPDYKPLIIDGKVPAYFVDGHAETLPVKSYTAENFDFR